MNKPAPVRNSIAREAALAEGRESFRKQAWSSAFSQLSAADREAQLEPEDLERLAMAAHLIGREADSADFLARAHQASLSRGETRFAARCALWLGMALFSNGEMAQASGWISRARRLLEDGQHDCVEQGYLLMPAGIRSVHEGNAKTAHTLFVEAAAIGERFGDVSLVTLARMGQGRALIRQREIARGVSLLDEAMVAVTAGEVSPIVAGGVYCSVIEACGEIFDLRRAQEWTSALEHWCSTQPDMVPYRGHCMVRRAEILQLHGAWPSALDEALRARERFSHPAPKPGIGAAFYRVAELHRLRGEFAEADAAYRQASQWEKSPQPGFAQFLLAQGQLAAAHAAIRHVADEVRDGGSRSRVLDAYVEITLAVNDVPAARAAADELARIADGFDSPLLKAMSGAATGAVLLAERDARAALAALRSAFTRWRELEAPYEAARVQVLMALACRELGNGDAADMELNAARDVFQQLGAAPALARVDALLRTAEPKAAGPLTAREVEVLVLVASGGTNRAIASELGISEKTIARHISNIFTKLNLPSRAAGTAYAYENGLVRPPST